MTLTLGFRGEFSTGWNEAHGRAANYTFTDGVISSQPRIASSAFTTNNAKFLPEPRIGFAWSPYQGQTVVRAGFGIYNELQDALGYRMDQNAPFNPTYSIASLPVSQLPIDPLAPVPKKALLVPGGVQPNLKMPTLISYSLRVEQASDPNTSLTLGYVGSHGYHELVGLDANTPVPTICPASPCPATYPKSFPGGVGRNARSGRVLLHSGRNAEGKPDPGQYLDMVFHRRQQLQCAASRPEPSLQPRSFVPGGLYLVKGLDDGDSLNRHDRGKCAGAGGKSVRHKRRLGACDLRCQECRRHQRRLCIAIRERKSVCQQPGRLQQCVGGRMVGQQHRHCCSRDSRSRRSSATTLRITATRAIRCGRL